MSNTEQMVSMPTECQFHNNCGGWCETPRQVEHNLCEDCLEAHDEDRPAAQRQGEPVACQVEFIQGETPRVVSWNDRPAGVYQFYTHPAPSVQQGEQVAWVIFDNGFIDDHTTDKDLADGWRDQGLEVSALYTHPDAGEVERLRYKADLYDEVWELATGLGYMNVTTAISTLRTDLRNTQALLDQANHHKAQRGETIGTLSAQLDECESMAAMILEREWAEHAGKGPVSAKVEAAFTDLHNELSESRAQLTERDATLRELCGKYKRGTLTIVDISAVLSASADPKSCGSCAGCTDGCQLEKDSPPSECQHRYMHFGGQDKRRCADCSKVELSAPVEAVGVDPLEGEGEGDKGPHEARLMQVRADLGCKP